MERHWYYHEVDIMGRLSEDEKAALLQRSLRKEYVSGGIVYSPGDEGALVYLVVDGRIKIYNLSGSGKEIIYRFCGPDTFFGVAEIFGGEEREVFAEAVDNTEVRCIPKESFEQLVLGNSVVAFSVMRMLGNRVRQAHHAIKNLAFSDAHSRLAQLLIKLGEIAGTSAQDGSLTLNHRFTHQEMASMIGSTRQTVTEMVNELKRVGCIRYEQGIITITDYARLQSLVQE